MNVKSDKSKLQKLKDLGLLGAIQDPEITSENLEETLIMTCNSPTVDRILPKDI